jgi:hypothetical protein
MGKERFLPPRFMTVRVAMPCHAILHCTENRRAVYGNLTLPRTLWLMLTVTVTVTVTGEPRGCAAAGSRGETWRGKRVAD